MSKIVSFDDLKKALDEKNHGIKHMGTLEYVVKGGEVSTKEEHMQRKLKKEEIERRAKERL